MRQLTVGLAAASLLWGALAEAPALAQDGLEADRAKAMQGDVDAQRRLASCLGEEPGDCPAPPTEPSPAEACAWRMVIIASGHARIDASDTANYERDCSYRTISQLEQVAALTQAERVFREIYSRDISLLPLLNP